MSDLDRELRELVRDARPAEEPADAVRDRIREGVLARAAGAAAAAAVTAASKGAGASLAPKFLSTAASVSLWTKLTLGTLAVAGVVAVAVGIDESPKPSSREVPAEPAPPTSESQEHEPAPAISQEEPQEEPSVAPSAKPPSVRPKARTQPLKPPPTKPREETAAPTGSALRVELEVLRRAHGQLQSGDATGALSTLDAHEREHPGGAMGAERAALRVLALCQLGRVAEARQIAERLQSAAPDSPAAKRLQSSCAANGGNSP